MLKFPQKFQPDRVQGEPADRYAAALGKLTKAATIFAPYAGTSFGGGIYRLYSAAEIERWTKAVEDAFPDYAGRVRCFGRDWLCNQFCLDRDRVQDGEAQVLLFEIATGQVLKSPETLETFHECLLLEDADAALAEQLFESWKRQAPLALRAQECVGYRVPLFLGGLDDLGNLEKADVDVYWHLTTQMLGTHRNLPPGTPINNVKRDQ
jgi:hypothetical protein